MDRDFFTARLVETRAMGSGYALLRLQGCGPLSGARAGQFVMLRGDWGRDPILPRAYSILSCGGDEARFLVQQVGRGSGLLARATPGAPLTVLGPLGNGFPEPGPGQSDLLVAGGCGLPPLHLAASQAAEAGRASRVELLLGARTADQLLPSLLDELREPEIAIQLATEDGSAGQRGLVTDLLERRLGETDTAREAGGLPGSAGRARETSTTRRILACGPPAMLRAVREVARRHDTRCFLSLEAEMACGLGACLGCAVQARRGSQYLHVCADGPVFDGEDVWP